MCKDCRTRKQLLAALKQAEAKINELTAEKQRHATMIGTFSGLSSYGGQIPGENSEFAAEIDDRLNAQGELPDIDGCKQTQDELIKTKDFLEKVLDAVEDPIFVKDSKHRLVLANAAECSLTGRRREELLGCTVNDFFPEPLAEIFREMDELVLSTGLSQIFEQMVPDVGGRLRTWQTKKSLYVDPFGEKFVVGITRDVTESKQAEEDLRKRLMTLTQPSDDKAITFEALLDLEDLQRVQDAFSDISGIASIITTPDGTPITKPSNFCRLCKDIIRSTEKGRANCFHSDSVIGRQNPGGPIIQPCLSGGLWDAGASITVGGKHVANWLIGQVRTEGQDERRLLDYARTIGADEEEFAQALREVPIMPQERLEKIAQAMFVLANKLSLLAYQNLQQAKLLHEREQREERLRASLQEKEILLREVHHRVKNNLQIISSLLSLQSSKVLDQWALDLFMESRNRIAAMALVHEELYSAGDFSRVSLKKYLEKIVPRLANPASKENGPTCMLQLEEVELSIEKAVPFGLIINELVTNAVKHGFRECQKGELRVGAHLDGSILTVIVADNGPGLPPDFDLGSSETLGMQLVLGLARQIRGTFQAQNACGATFTLAFPLD
ncbi:PAS domain S-box [Desulfocurvibacter africanus PCS]|uniref:PAS domain S-box n=2 Tax=Desulfocurvibacter africanus TaxID=873 RepID=M5Q2F9_DESAF|nr:PAS domain S-box [Desulfocurvibacter africanus PCS]